MHNIHRVIDINEGYISLTDDEKKKALYILEKASEINTRIAGLQRVEKYLTQHYDMLMQDGVRLSPRTQKNHRERLNELHYMIAEYKHQKQCVVDVINLIIESTRFEEGSKQYLTLRYIEGLQHEIIAEKMCYSSDHLKRKKKKALSLFCKALETICDDADVQSLVEGITKNKE